MYLALESSFESLQLCKPGLLLTKYKWQGGFTSLAYTHLHSSSSFSTKVMMMDTSHKNLGLLGQKKQENEKKKRKRKADFIFAVHHCIKQSIPGFFPLHQGTPTEYMLKLKWCIGVLYLCRPYQWWCSCMLISCM